MSTALTEEPGMEVATVEDDDGDRWVRGADGLWVCATNDCRAMSWTDLKGMFGPLSDPGEIAHPPVPPVGSIGEVREFDIRCTALLAAATAFKRDGDLEDDWEDHGASIVAKARSFEPYLRGEAK